MKFTRKVIPLKVFTYKLLWVLCVLGSRRPGLGGAAGGRQGMSNNLIMELNGTIELFLHQFAMAAITETQKCCDFLQSNGLLMPTTGIDPACPDS